MLKLDFRKGLQQGPMEQFGSNNEAETFNELAAMLMKAQQRGMIEGLVPHWIPQGIALLQYVDDTILTFQGDIDMARTVKIMLYTY